MQVELIGRYAIRQRIGEGAMADVYRAHDPSIGRDLAIKILKQELRQNEEVKGRFLREARAAGALSHAGIVTIYDVGEADGYPYIAMELLDGEPLDEALSRQGKLPVADVLRLGQQIASALAYAHGLGVVHRDIKPSNIMLCDGGRNAKILDFGIARVGESDRVRAEVAMLRTQVGQVLGTPRYMSPEQALGLDIDHRSDLFSLGAVLYEMASGEPAFDGGSLATIAIQITREQPARLKSVLSDCPAGLQFIVDKLLAKDPDRRFANGSDLAEALRREHRAMTSDKPARKSPLPLQLRLSLLLAAVTATALLVAISTVLGKQHETMERVALTSGKSIATFVANNVALRAVDNASIPEPQQDWMPVQAFIASASQDPNIGEMVMVDSRGIVRGASRAALVGKPYRPAAGEPIEVGPDHRISALGERGYRFDRDILYAGDRFGRIHLTVGRAQLDAAAVAARNMMIALGRPPPHRLGRRCRRKDGFPHLAPPDGRVRRAVRPVQRTHGGDGPAPAGTGSRGGHRFARRHPDHHHRPCTTASQGLTSCTF
jgi:serine/threonine-protein kinase